jgi:hypothetical protein
MVLELSTVLVLLFELGLVMVLHLALSMVLGFLFELGSLFVLVFLMVSGSELMNKLEYHQDLDTKMNKD